MTFTQGWRAFYCDECGWRWIEASRDHTSPSGDNCPQCQAWQTPIACREDLTLTVDENGNLSA